MLYGPVAHRVAPPTGEPGKAPASKAIQTCAAVILPSLVAPILVLIVVADVGPVPSNTSLRLITSLTGRPVFFDMMAASGSR